MKSLKYIIVLGIVTGVTFSSLVKTGSTRIPSTLWIIPLYSIRKRLLSRLWAVCYGYLTTQDCFGQGVYEMSVGSSGLSWSQTNGSEPDRYASLNATTAGDAACGLGEDCTKLSKNVILSS